MRRALALARRGAGLVEPNPMVGCVLVKSGRVIGEGYHRAFGGPHAEVFALRSCKVSPQGATAYVTLEPCCYFGKTPPCTEALLQAGVARVVAAVRDPNPRVSGRGLRLLRSRGVNAEEGVLRAEATQLNAPFFKLVRSRRPWIILKWAQSLDGVIATRTGDSKWISGPAARRHTHGTRGRVDAIVVGVNTVLRDDPLLTCRDAPRRRVATRIVLDSALRTPATSQLVRTRGDAPVWIVGAPTAPKTREKRLAAAGCRVIRLAADSDGVSLGKLLDELGAHGMANVLVEGGGRLLGRFVDQGLGDEFHLYVAPMLIGGADAIGALHGSGPALVTEATKLDILETKKLGADVFIRARVRGSKR
ncbi:MAG: bifunctional diaminohydroxyphosphoribosylaminopyrimidine deaminase/5-amino-6-(5-phosphoribosylamino)uracil reductase RibD [Planctomycetes bacterium]|nr:bifunctional diaminohydroxyphosphoribosylaminopyrimidine deaminase/5-amino-6-(5-phosphoribosylamino)uracil reductase RibD [Planctomycetota bacterium]